MVLSYPEDTVCCLNSSYQPSSRSAGRPCSIGVHEPPILKKLAERIGMRAFSLALFYDLSPAELYLDLLARRILLFDETFDISANKSIAHANSKDLRLGTNFWLHFWHFLLVTFLKGRLAR